MSAENPPKTTYEVTETDKEGSIIEEIKKTPERLGEPFSEEELNKMESKLKPEREQWKLNKEASDKKDAEKLAEVKGRLEKLSERENKEKESEPKAQEPKKEESPEKKKSWGEKTTKERIQTVGKYGAIGAGGIAVAGVGAWTAATIAGNMLAPLAATPVFGAAAGLAGFSGAAALVGAGAGAWFGVIAVQEFFKAYKAAGGIGGIFKIGGGKGGGGHAAPKKASGGDHGGGHGGGGGHH